METLSIEIEGTNYYVHVQLAQEGKTTLNKTIQNGNTEYKILFIENGTATILKTLKGEKQTKERIFGSISR